MCGIDLNDGSFQKKKNHRYFYTKDNKSDTVSMKNVKSEKSEVEKHVSLRGSH